MESKNSNFFPKLNAKQEKELSLIRPFYDQDSRQTYYPCDVLLSSGEVRKNVLLMEASNYDDWGTYTGINISEVKSIMESKNRFPEHIEVKLGRLIETAMGGWRFQLILKDGSKLLAETGSVKVFLDLPDGVKREDVTDVDWNQTAAPSYYFGHIITASSYCLCVYS